MVWFLKYSIIINTMDKLRKELKAAQKDVVPIYKILSKKHINLGSYKPDSETKLTSEELKIAIIGDKNKPQ